MSTAKKLTLQYAALLLAILVCVLGFAIQAGGATFLDAYRDPALLAGFSGMAIGIGLMLAMIFATSDL